MNGHGPPPPPPPDSSFNSDSDSDSDSKSKCKSKSYLFSDHSYPYSYSIPNTPTLLLLRLKLASFHTPWTGPGPRSFRKSDNSNIGLVEGRRAHWLRGWVCRYGRCLFRTLVKKRGASGARPKAHPFFGGCFSSTAATSPVPDASGHRSRPELRIAPRILALRSVCSAHTTCDRSEAEVSQARRPPPAWLLAEQWPSPKT